LSRPAISRRALVGAGVAGAGLVGAGLLLRRGSAADGPRAPARGGYIRVATQSSSTSDTLDPAKGALSTDYVRHFMLYNGLTTIAPDMSTQLSLAEAIESDDLVDWTIRLRRGITFHDGADLTADDVVWSLRRHKDASVGSTVATIAEQFANIAKVDRETVRLRLTGANADLPTILSQSQFLIVRNGETSPAGNGTGPFKLSDFRPGVRTLVVRNPDYWVPDRPRLEGIELISIPDEVSRVNALLSGDVQLINAIDPRSTRRIEASAGHDLLVTRSGLYTDLVMRQGAMPTGNVHFSAAIKHMIDRPLVNRALFRDFATIGNDQPIPPFHPLYNPNVGQTTVDLDKARWHLRQSGVGRTLLPVYASPAATGSIDMASILQEYGARIGLNLAVNRVPADGYWSTHWGRHPLSFGNTNPRPTADLIFSLFYKSDAEWNVSGWQNERFDRLLIAARGETNQALREEMYGEMQQLVHDHCGVMIPVFISLIDGFDARLKGLEPVPLGGLGGYRFAEDAWWEA